MLTWTNEKRKIDQLIPAQYNPRQWPEKETKSIKICNHCNNKFQDLAYNKKRKYCSRKCWSYYCHFNLKEWITNPLKTGLRNKNPIFRTKVSDGLKKYYEKYRYGRLSRKHNFDYGWSGWDRIRARIISRDIICQSCGSNKNLRVHHIIPVKSNGTNKPNNLIVLCNRCHQGIEKNQISIYKIVGDWKIVKILMLDSLLERRIKLSKLLTGGKSLPIRKQLN